MAQSLDEATVRHVAHLARLAISDAEVTRLAGQLSDILRYVDQLGQLDTKDVPPTAHALGISNVFREDRVQPCWDTECALANAPMRQDSFFRVPKVLDQESD